MSANKSPWKRMLSNFKNSQPVRKSNDQSLKIFVKNMASIPPLHRAQGCGGWCHQWYKEGAKWLKEWLVLVNKLPFFSFFLPIPYIGVSMEQQRSPGLDQLENWFHIIREIQSLLPRFLNAPPPVSTKRGDALRAPLPRFCWGANCEAICANC